MKYKNFNEFLQYRHSKENPTILDDDLPDAYEDWLAELSIDELIEYGNIYGLNCKIEANNKIKI